MTNRVRDTSWLPALQRQIRIVSEVGRLRARMVDNVHDLSLTIDHDGTTITAVTAKAVRIPWTTCPGAMAQFQQIVGAAIDQSSPGGVDKSRQCTHLFDLARIAISKADVPGEHALDVHVAPTHAPSVLVAWALIDGREILRWRVADGHILSPDPFSGHAISGSAAWLGAVDDEDVRVAALQIKRALLVYFGTRESEQMRYASELAGMTGVCFSFQPENLKNARRPDDFHVLPADKVG